MGCSLPWKWLYILENVCLIQHFFMKIVSECSVGLTQIMKMNYSYVLLCMPAESCIPKCINGNADFNVGI